MSASGNNESNNSNALDLTMILDSSDLRNMAEEGSSTRTSDRQRALFANLVKQYFYQLLYGCANLNCQSQYCRSNRNLVAYWDRNSATNLALALAKKGPIFLCNGESVRKFAQDPSPLMDSNNGNVLQIGIEDLKQKVSEFQRDQNVQKLASYVYQIFSKTENLCCCFPKKNLKDLDALDCPTDFDQVREAYKILIACPEVVQKALLTGAENILSVFKSVQTQLHLISKRHFVVFLILLENPLFIDPTVSHESILPIMCELLARVSYLDDEDKINEDVSAPLLSASSINKDNNGKALIKRWVTTDFNSSQFSKLVSVIQQFITMRLLAGFQSNPNKDEAVMQATKALGIFYEANEVKNMIHYSEFYNDAINEQMEIKEDFPHWKAKEGFSFCNYPFILTASTKTDILKVESMVQMRHELQDAFFRAMFAGVQSPYLVLEIRRDFIIRDALYQLDNKLPQDLKKQLRVQFVGEEGVDEGGVQKEFFQLVIREMFDPKYGMFQVFEESQLVWFMNNPHDDELALDEYRLVGRLIGLAIYNSVILDVHFPLALYKKLMNKTCDIDDLTQLDPAMGHGLKQLLTFDGDVSEFYERTFEIEYEVFGAKHTHELKENGSKIQLVNENREEFVALYIDFLFHTSVFKQFNAFKEGFDSVCSGSAIQLFRPEELELLVCGSSDLDFEALEKVTVYDGGFSKESPIIKSFWAIVHQFSQEEKKKLLFFATGTDRVPIGGLSKLNFVIAKNGSDSDRLPTSHTCFNVLLLPDYQDASKLKERLLTAIQNAEGFGLI